jgi:hypothetical protein
VNRVTRLRPASNPPSGSRRGAARLPRDATLSAGARISPRRLPTRARAVVPGPRRPASSCGCALERLAPAPGPVRPPGPRLALGRGGASPARARTARRARGRRRSASRPTAPPSRATARGRGWPGSGCGRRRSRSSRRPGCVARPIPRARVSRPHGCATTCWTTRDADDQRQQVEQQPAGGWGRPPSAGASCVKQHQRHGRVPRRPAGTRLRRRSDGGPARASSRRPP